MNAYYNKPVPLPIDRSTYQLAENMTRGYAILAHAFGEVP
jgi:hypothetical protein